MPLTLVMALGLMFCEPGKTLDPVVDAPAVDTGKAAAIVVVEAPGSLLPTDTGLVKIAVRDSADSLPLAGARLFVSSTQFKILSATGDGNFATDSVPIDGQISFRIFSSTPGNGTVTIRVVSGEKQRSRTVSVIVTEKPVAPKVVEQFPTSLVARDTARLTLTVLDSAQERPLPNAVVTLTSAFFTIHPDAGSGTLADDTTGSDGRIAFRLAAGVSGAGTLQARVRTAAGITRNYTYTLTVNEAPGAERPRKMVFTALRSTLRADGSDSTELRVLVKDDNNNPLAGEKLRFTATGGLVRANATTDDWGRASTFLVSERANKTVVVTATLEKTGATAQQTVSFDGVAISISPDKQVLMQNTPNPVIFELRDGGNVPMSGDSLEVTIQGAYRDWSGDALGSRTDTVVVVTDTKGQFRGSFTRQSAGNVILSARALGARTVDTVIFTNNSLTLSLAGGKTSLTGNGIDQITINAVLRDGSNNGLDGRELRWTTTFGDFTGAPFTTTSGGNSSITLRAPKGSGLATVNVEAYTKGTGDARTLLASGNITIPVRALKVERLELKVTPDNIPVKVGEARLVAKAYDSADNVMNGVLIGFRLVRGAGGGDETITPPIDYSKAGTAEATIKAGGVISLYQGVKIAAVALDISGSDTLVIASSDTVGLTVSGPPHKVSIGVNIEKGLNPEDGTFGLPTAAVVTDVNGNLVADGTPVNFSTSPIASLYPTPTYTLTNTHPYYVFGTDSIWHYFPWTDYNNNGRLDPGEPSSRYNSSRPARGEDMDGNGVVNLAPEDFTDWNGNGVWDSANAEPLIPGLQPDSTGQRPFVDFNRNGIRDLEEDYTDLNGNGTCDCTGKRDANGYLWERMWNTTVPNRPFPGDAAVGIQKQVSTLGGKAVTQVIYVQTLANRIEVRITAEADGIRASVDAILPVVKSEE
jgi:hypothetical protein